MSKPKNMTPEQEAEWRKKYNQKAKAGCKRWREKNPEAAKEAQRKWRIEKGREYQKKWRQKNREGILKKQREADRALRLANPELVRQRARDSYRKNIEKNREAARRQQANLKARLGEAEWRRRSAERSKLNKQRHPEARKQSANRYAKKAAETVTDTYACSMLGLPVDVARKHPDLLIAKREQIKALRQLKKQTKQTNAQES